MWFLILALFSTLPLLCASTYAQKHGPVKYFDLVVSLTTSAPDGHERASYAVNGQSPGPLLEMNSGDRMVVYVQNNLNQSMTMHFHGINNKGAPWMDGVPGVSQYVISPGSNFTYVQDIPDSDYGVYWYHAHTASIYHDGVRGPVMVHAKSSISKPYSAVAASTDAYGSSGDYQAILAAEANAHYASFYDWRHTMASIVEPGIQDTGLPAFCANSLLFNGKGRITCQSQKFLEEADGGRHLLFGVPIDSNGCILGNSTKTELAESVYWYDAICKDTDSPVEVFDANGASWVMIHFIDMSAGQQQSISIDGHSMWVIMVDGTYITPQKVNIIDSYIGSRYTVLVKLDQKPGDYSIRSGGNYLFQILQGTAILRYGESTAGKIIKNKEWMAYNTTTIRNAVRFDSTAASPYSPQKPPTGPADYTFNFGVGVIGNVSIVMNLQPFSVYMELDEPILWSKLNDSALVKYIKHNSVVDIIIHDIGERPFRHPIHLHGHKFWVIGQGISSDFTQTEVNFPFADVASAEAAGSSLINLNNPPLRDVMEMQAGSWVVMRYIADNPGAWFFHCHNGDHQYAGMAMVMYEGAELIDNPKYPQWEVPAVLKQKPSYDGFKV